MLRQPAVRVCPHLKLCLARGCLGRSQLRVERQDRRQDHAKSAATLRAVEAENLPAMLLNNAVANTQAEACAFADGLGGVERVKDTIGLAQARTGIGKIEDHASALRTHANKKRATTDRFHSVHRIVD